MLFSFCCVQLFYDWVLYGIFLFVFDWRCISFINPLVECDVSSNFLPVDIRATNVSLIAHNFFLTYP
jgi:hypothetical protein